MLSGTVMNMNGMIKNNMEYPWVHFKFEKQWIGSKLIDIAMWENLLMKVINFVCIFILLIIIQWVIYRLIDYTLVKWEQKGKSHNPRRIVTIGRLFKNMLSFSIKLILLVIILMEFHVDLMTIVTGAGILGLALGFGAQSLVKDVIMGFFIILEEYFSVGDVVKIGEFQGKIEIIGIRSTRMSSWTGEVHIIPNGNIKEVTNYSLNNSLALIDVSVAYEKNVDDITAIINKALETLPKRNSNVVKVPQVLGIQTLNPSQITLRIAAECYPFTQSEVKREIYADIKKALEQPGIYPQRKQQEQ